MSTRYTVFVVQRETDGVWEANCCDLRCGIGLHGITEDESEAAAQRAASKHRRELAAVNDTAGVPPARCPECGQRVPTASKETPR